MKKRVRKSRVFIVFVVLAAILCVSVFLYTQRITPLDRASMSILDLIDRDTIETNIKDEFKESYELSDYGIYGQTLSFYREKYSQSSKDSIIGSTIVLVNVQTQNEYTYVAGEGIDSGINLENLEEGLYEIYIYDRYDRKRVYFEDSFSSEEFMTMRSKGKVKYITLHADKDYLKEKGVRYDENYAFLAVMENIPKKQVADIVLDPGGMVAMVSSMTTDEGLSSEFINEAQATLEFCQLLKSKLEEKGLSVIVTREEDQVIGYYGSNSRVGMGYEANAKAFLSFQFYETEEANSPYLMTGNSTSGLFANEMAYHLKADGISLAHFDSSDRLADSVVYDPATVDEKENVYDLYPQIRETGGKMSFAGKMEMAQANSEYANVYGMESVLIFLGNVNSQESIDAYKQNKEQIADCIVKAICSYYGIQGETDETTS